MFTAGLYGSVIVLLSWSFLKDRGKTGMALKKAWKALEKIMPQFLAIMLIIGIMLAILTPREISRLIGSGSGWIGTAVSALTGSITLIPGFVAFPMTAALLKNGAGLMQTAVFISTLMMVGVVTFPLEKEYFGVKVALLRNVLAFAFSFIVAIVMGGILK
jgi:uncharacterized membrane protein YraQ (UPF0718 family)